MVSLASQDQIQRKMISKSKSCEEEEIKTTYQSVQMVAKFFKFLSINVVI